MTSEKMPLVIVVETYELGMFSDEKFSPEVIPVNRRSVALANSDCCVIQNAFRPFRSGREEAARQRAERTERSCDRNGWKLRINSHRRGAATTEVPGNRRRQQTIPAPLRERRGDCPGVPSPRPASPRPPLWPPARMPVARRPPPSRRQLALVDAMTRARDSRVTSR